MHAFIDKKKTSSSSGTPIRKKSKKASNPQKRELWNTEDQHFSHFPLSSISPDSVQPKLTIGKSNDKYEQEADRVADAVMRMPDNRFLAPTMLNKILNTYLERCAYSPRHSVLISAEIGTDIFRVNLRYNVLVNLLKAQKEAYRNFWRSSVPVFGPALTYI